MNVRVGKIKPARPRYPLRDLTREEKRDHAHKLLGPYAKFEAYPTSIFAAGVPVGKYWTAEELRAARRRKL